jgi:hypothetical protein
MSHIRVSSVQVAAKEWRQLVQQQVPPKTRQCYNCEGTWLPVAQYDHKGVEPAIWRASCPINKNNSKRTWSRDRFANFL